VVVAIALIFARLLGYFFYKLKQPPVLGEIIAGILLGGIALFLSEKSFTVFNYSYHFINLRIHQWPEFVFLAEIGILFLLFISGLETRLSNLKKMGKNSAFVAIGGVILPLVLGFLAGILLDFSFGESLVIGLILTATSVGVTVRALIDLNVLDTNVGTTILGAAVIDDVIGIILLAFVLGIDSPLWIGLKLLIYFLIFLYLGLKVIDRILELGEKIHLPKAFLSISLGILLIYSFFATKAGMAGIIGAFVAGLIIGQTVQSRKIADDVKAFGYGFFIPIFFVWVGTFLWDVEYGGLEDFTMIIVLTIVIVLISIIGKIAGSSLGAKIAGMSYLDSLRVGVGMVPRMEIALVIATTAISHGVLTGFKAHQILVTTILLVVITTLITPFLIKATFKK